MPQRSTGPRTPKSKARSAQNARNHGFIASNFAVVRVEDLDAANLKADLVSTCQPLNSQELFGVPLGPSGSRSPSTPSCAPLPLSRPLHRRDRSGPR